jgi:hypothetical protein
MRRLLAFVAGCGSAAAAPHGEVHRLVEVERTPVVAAQVAIAGDGRWLAAEEHDLVLRDGTREVARYRDLAIGGLPLVALAGGRWLAGIRLLDANGAVQFEPFAWAQRFGRFGAIHAMAATPDGKVAIAAASDSPSLCLCDQKRGTAGSSAGELVRLTFGEGAPRERVLVAHREYRNFVVAASADSLAAIDGTQLSIWPARGDGAPITSTVPADIHDLVWLGDRLLIAVRPTGTEHDDVVIFDRDAGFASTAFTASGNIRALAIRPGRRELALGVTRYRAHQTVEVDERAIDIVDLAGSRHARVDIVRAYPLAVAWSPDGESLLVASDAGTIRYGVD